MEPIALLPEGIAGTRDFDYITPKGRRLTEYEAVTCYTQPQPEVGGLQHAGELMLRNDGRPVYDLASTKLRADDWFAFRDPNQMWQRPYYTLQSGVEKSIERTTQVAVSTGAVNAVVPQWIERGLMGAYFPFAHVEYGLFRALNLAARESLSDTVNSILVFNAADKLRHAQAIAILGLDLEAALSGFDGTAGRDRWLTAAEWQPVRRLVEEVMAIQDWCETVVAVSHALEPLLGEPLRRLVFQLAAANRRDTIVPVIAAGATADWHRNIRATRAFLTFLADGSHGHDNRKVISEWSEGWRARTGPVADALIAGLEDHLEEPGLAEGFAAVAAEETDRAGVELATSALQ